MHYTFWKLETENDFPIDVPIPCTKNESVFLLLNSQLNADSSSVSKWLPSRFLFASFHDGCTNSDPMVFL